MAFYDYKCNACGFKTTISKPMADATLVEYCPAKCAPYQPMERVWDAPPAALIHKGTPKFHQRSVS